MIPPQSGAEPKIEIFEDTINQNITGGYGAVSLPKYQDWEINNTGTSKILFLNGGWIEGSDRAGKLIEAGETLKVSAYDAYDAFAQNNPLNSLRAVLPKLHFYVIGAATGSVEITSNSTRNYLEYKDKRHYY